MALASGVASQVQIGLRQAYVPACQSHEILLTVSVPAGGALSTTVRLEGDQWVYRLYPQDFGGGPLGARPYDVTAQAVTSVYCTTSDGVPLPRVAFMLHSPPAFATCDGFVLR